MNDTDRQECIAGLRELADFLDAHPEVAAPLYSSLLSRVNTREDLMAVAQIGGWKKVYEGEYFTLRRTFAGVTLDVYTDRTTVCRKVVTGQRVVPARPECTEDVFEWVCEEQSLLAGERK